MIRILVKWLISCLAVVLPLAGCSSLRPSPPVAAPPPDLFLDGAFAPPALPVRAADALAVSPEMRAFLDRERLLMRVRGTGFGLVDSLLRSGVLTLEYDAHLTRTAAEAFEARSGNCLSLVLLTSALARELGLPVSYQQVETSGLWTRSGSLYMDLSHVNISVARDRADSPYPGLFDHAVTIDFQPAAAASRSPTWPISEQRVLAMYASNRAAEHLVDGHTDSAYWSVRAALQADPDYVDALNTLGVVYLRHGLAEQGVAVLQYARTRDPAHPHVLGNLANGLEQLGRKAEAATVQAELERVRAVRPFRFYDEGLRAIELGDFERARSLLEREWRRNGLQFHELHLNLARVYLHFGDHERARRQLELARDASTTRAQQALYKAKLEHLAETAPR